MNLLDALLMSRKLKFEDGSIALYGDNVTILPLEGFIMYAGEISDDMPATKLLYSTMRNSMLEQRQKLTTESKNSNFSEWICDSVNIYGYGKIKYEKPAETPKGVLILNDSPFVKILKGRSSNPVDHIVRGAIAGISSAITGQDLHVLETDCAVSGRNSCKFVLDSKDKLAADFEELFKQQI